MQPYQQPFVNDCHVYDNFLITPSVYIGLLRRFIIFFAGANPTNTLTCNPEVDDIAGCSETDPTSTGSGFKFKYLDCKTPKITAVDPNINGTTQDTITITGTGFSATDCRDEVKIGDNTCTVDSASATQIQCRIEDPSAVLVGSQMLANIRISNLGYAIPVIQGGVKRSVSFVPFISAVSPTSGSTIGGTLLTIDGGGFTGGTSIARGYETVSIGPVACGITSITSSKVICKTIQPGDTTNGSVVFRTYNIQDPIDSVCQDTCEFSFAASETPNITEVTPTTIDAIDTVLTITGTKFGTNKDNVICTLAGQQCIISTITDSTINCIVEEPIVGSQNLYFHVVGKGLADNKALAIEVDNVLESISPSIGSIHGGTLLTISGLGFKQGDTSVFLYASGSRCAVLSVTSTTITCTMPAHAGDRDRVRVRSNSTYYPMKWFTFAVTLNVTSLSVTTGSSGDSLTITGYGFSEEARDMAVTIDGASCTVTASTNNTVTVTLPVRSAGRCPVIVTHVKRGIADNWLNFTFQLSLDSVSPEEGDWKFLFLFFIQACKSN